MQLDTTAPEVSSEWTSKARKQLALSATDAGSGLAVIEFRVNGGAWSTYSGPIDVKGKDVVQARAKDLAGKSRRCRRSRGGVMTPTLSTLETDDDGTARRRAAGERRRAGAGDGDVEHGRRDLAARARPRRRRARERVGRRGRHGHHARDHPGRHAPGRDRDQGDEWRRGADGLGERGRSERMPRRRTAAEPSTSVTPGVVGGALVVLAAVLLAVAVVVLTRRRRRVGT